MSNLAIKTENLGKRYRLGATVDFTRTFREVLLDYPKYLLNLTKSKAKRLVEKQNQFIDPETPKGTFWALRDINLEIKHGEVVGIIGSNGAGKSTLLKILSRITTPTKGTATLYGRVGSLLEVGTGFHPELTGRENIYLNGSILGMSKWEIDKKFDEIVAFAEVEEFLDTPIKRYSSGMQVRLAFAVAAHLEPEILIVDEVLAVGDAAFQKKSLGKMEDVSKEGRTVLFVSHNMDAVKTLCERSILLEEGVVIDDGESEKIINNYLNLFHDEELLELSWPDKTKSPGNDYVKFKKVMIKPEYRNSNKVIDVSTPINLICEVYNKKDNADLSFHFVLSSNGKQIVFQTHSKSKKYNLGIIKAECKIPGNLLNDDIYFVDFLIFENQKRILNLKKIINKSLTFKVEDIKRDVGWLGKYRGVVRPKLEWKTEIY